MSSYLNTNSTVAKHNNENDDTIDFGKLISIVSQYWYLYVIGVFVCLSLAALYASFSEKVWHVTGKILVKDDASGERALSGSLSGETGSLFSVKSSADNEIQILKSRTLMQNTVAAMQLNIRTYVKSGFKKREIYNESPFYVNIVYKVDTIASKVYDVNIVNDTEFEISDGKDFKRVAKFGTALKLEQYDLMLRFKPEVKRSTSYQISISSPDLTAYQFSKGLSAALSDKQATTIDLSIDYPNSSKGEAILNKLMLLYLRSNLENEKQIADSTMAFIDSRIKLVSVELNNIERQFEQFKSQNNIANITEQSKALVASNSNYFDKLAQQETQLSIIEDLEKYLGRAKNRKVIPSSLINPADQSFGNAINSYNDLLINRDRATLSYTEDNPVIINLDKQIENSRASLLQNVETYKNSLLVGKSELQKQSGGFQGQLKQLPGKERNYLDFSRQQNLKQELYLFLLQKREETAITRNSTISSSRILDTAKSEFNPFKPKKSVIYLIGIMLGIVVPSIFLFVKNLLNVKINSKEDILKLTNIQVLGEIGHNSDKQSLVAGTNSRSVISEQFRALRTNLQFILEAGNPNVILFTSSMSGEGKSFLSLNLGSALALTNKRVVFMEMDLRKPKLSESVGLTIDNGFTNYAISENNTYDYRKLLKPLSFNKNCFLISSGPIPPNPAELLVNGKLEQLINALKLEFEYIIIDCAPVGLVADAMLIEKHVDVTLYVARQEFTYKSQMDIVNNLVKNNQVKNLYLIINDVKIQKTGYSAYQQAYGYGLENEKSTFLSKLKFWK